MVLLGPDDDLPSAPARILVHGCSGSGKSTVAALLGERLALPYTEIDSLFHGPGWTARPSFVEDVHRLAASPRWVAEWQYGSVRPLLLARADLVVWLDLPRRQTMCQVVARTVRRRVRRTELWNGNHEGPLWRLLIDDEHIIRWAWRTHPLAAHRAARILAERPGLPVVRLRSRAEAARWLDRLSASCGTPEPPR